MRTDGDPEPSELQHPGRTKCRHSSYHRIVTRVKKRAHEMVAVKWRTVRRNSPLKGLLKMMRRVDWTESKVKTGRTGR